MEFMVGRSSSAVLVSAALRAVVCMIHIGGLVGIAEAQNATTDPNEVSALNSVFQQWGISAAANQWNISGEPCSGLALNESPTIDDMSYNPFIKCDCTYNNSAICHITALKVYSQDVTGLIPDELWSLTYLTNLNLGLNVLTGNLSASIGNLTRLQYLDIRINSLSGRLPEELGLLTELVWLGFGSNNFEGPLPSALGNCTKLQQLYFDSSGVSGEIPPTFASLKTLATVWASDNELTGRIPDFIGNWSKLGFLRFEGNSFEGPIPSALSNLTSLTELRISGILNRSSSLDFIQDMKSLTVLVLRNNNIFDSIPSNIGEFQNLTLLDLSFNNIVGEIPGSLFNLSQLTHLFLGNNSLTGTLPSQKGSTLNNIDVSYNNLGGGLPSWADPTSMELNLAVNNFIIDTSSSSLARLNCLQLNFPCYRGNPRYSEFAVNSGGPQITASTMIIYERDNEALGPAVYNVTDSRRWGISNVGYPTGSNSPMYTVNSTSKITDTLDSELFQTARTSASSLRYYGLGLENGNYTVNLQFAETVILPGSQLWHGLGRRRFDVHIQGNRVLQDFDIRQAADGVDRRAVQRNFTAQVSENYLEVHLFWAGKGTCCIPRQGIYGPLISAISATPNFIPTVSNTPTTNERPSKDFGIGLTVGIVAGVGAFGLLVFAVFLFVQRRKRRSTLDDEDLLEFVSRPCTFSYAELKNATNDFNPANKLGEGGFGPVYKGKLNDGRVIAVKQLSATSHQGKNQFVAEIATISAVQQRNLVKLYGCCIEGSHRLLVYEYLQNKSLDQALFRKTDTNLDWQTRFNICLGVARGLAYLHEESRPRIVHRDVKASNILLDSDFVPKISDFGLAKLYDETKTHISTRIAGTIGYLAPEYALRGRLTEKADVFAFGVVALELVYGRPNVDTSFEEERLYLLEWAWHLYEDNREVEMVDSSLADFDAEEVRRVIRVAFLCTQNSPALRPSMSRVIAMLSGDVEIASITTKPGYFTDWKKEVLSSFITSTATDRSYDNSSTSIEANAGQSPVSSTKPILHEIIGNGRSCS